MTAWQKLLINLAELVKVKTIVTFTIVFVFCAKIMSGMEISPVFACITGSVITYYFCKDNKDSEASKHNKINNKLEAKKDANPPKTEPE